MPAILGKECLVCIVCPIRKRSLTRVILPIEWGYAYLDGKEGFLLQGLEKAPQDEVD